MGLIDQATRHSHTERPADSKKKTGLLNRIRESSEFDALVSGFERFLQNNKVEKAILLTPANDGFLVPVLCENFDLTTCRRFIPSAMDFVRLIPEDRAYTFSGPDMVPFDPFFSSHERTSLDSIHIFPRRPDNERCYLVVVESRLNFVRIPVDPIIISKEALELDRVLLDKAAVVSALSVSKPLNRNKEVNLARIESAVADGKNAALITLSFTKLFNDPLMLETDERLMSIYHAIIHRVARQCGENNIVQVNPDLEVRLVVFTSSTADTDLYVRQMMRPMERLFGSFRISRVETKFHGSVSSTRQILEFMAGVD